MRFSLLHSAVIGFFLGVAVHSLWSVPPAFFLVLFSDAAVLLVYFRFIRKKEGKHRSDHCFQIIFIFLLAFSIGMIRYELSEWKKDNPDVEARVGEKVSIIGVIADEPAQKQKNTRLTVRIESLEGRAVHGAVTATADLYSDFAYGDRVSLTGKLGKPENIEPEPGERAFDYVAWLAKDGIYYEMKLPKITLIAHDAGNPLRASLFRVKNSFVGKINSILSPPQSSLLAGILVAGKGSLGAELTDEFNRAGAIQIVVLSGYNVTIVVEAAMSILSFLPRALGLSVGAVGIVFFTIMTGASATVVRAAVMALVALLGRAVGREYSVVRALLIAAVVMVFQNPKLLLFDPSLQLSFLATLGLILFTPLVEPWCTYLPERFKLREAVVTSIAAQLFVLPYILWQIGLLSFVSLFVNVLVMAFIPATMLIGFCATMLAFVSSGLAFPLTFVAQLLLTYELWIVHIFAALPFAAVQVAWFPWWLMLAAYALFGIILYKKARRSGGQ